MSDRDWKKAMKEAGFKYMNFVRSAKEIISRGSDGLAPAYRAVVVNMEITSPSGHFSTQRVEVDMTDLEYSPNPGNVVCDRVLEEIKGSLKLAGIEK